MSFHPNSRNGRDSRRFLPCIEALECRQMLSVSTPFHGVAFAEGQRIEAEDYDLGGPNVAYHDTTLKNLGNAGYRTSESVDIVTGGENGKFVGFAQKGEWINYTISVPLTGQYVVLARVANAGIGAQFHYSFDNNAIISNKLTVQKTGDWNKWQTVLSNRMTLSAGKHVMRLWMDANSVAGAVGNFDWLRVTQAVGPSTDNWKLAASSPAARFEGYGHVVNGKLYTFGGYTAVNPFGINETGAVYDPATNKWRNLGPAPIPETHAAVAVDQANGWMYFVGGLVGLYDGPPSTAVYKYDTNTNTWTTLPALPEAVAAGGAALVNGQLHYFGGIKSDSRYIDYDTHYVLDLNNLDAGWQAASAMPNPRDHFSTVTVAGKVYILGGEIGHDQLHDQQYEVDIYDPASDTWTRGADMPVARSHAESSTFVTDDGKIVIGGGQIDDFKAAGSIFKYDPASDRWTELAPLPIPLEGVDLQQVGSKLIVSMGYDGLSGVASTRTWVGTWAL
jgi:N-acetylneuraminic acid mutarotase